jgi:hypothetical protein
MKSNISANLDDIINRPDDSFQEFRLNAAAFSSNGDGPPKINIFYIHEEISVTSRHDNDAVITIDFYGNVPVTSQGNATTVSAESYQMAPPSLRPARLHFTQRSITPPPSKLCGTIGACTLSRRLIRGQVEPIRVVHQVGHGGEETSDFVGINDAVIGAHK